VKLKGHHRVFPIELKLPVMNMTMRRQAELVSFLSLFKEVVLLIVLGVNRGNCGTDSDEEYAIPTVRHFRSPSNGNNLFWYSSDVELVQILRGFHWSDVYFND
jgi:hypothetical protein